MHRLVLESDGLLDFQFRQLKLAIGAFDNLRLALTRGDLLLCDQLQGLVLLGSVDEVVGPRVGAFVLQGAHVPISGGPKVGRFVSLEANVLILPLVRPYPCLPLTLIRVYLLIQPQRVLHRLLHRRLLHLHEPRGVVHLHPLPLPTLRRCCLQGALK
jgi:hypothetical protein